MQQVKDEVVLLAVLEYGELPELLRVAEVAAATLGATAIFMFVKQSYRRLAEDTAAVIRSGFMWMDADGRIQSSAASPQSTPTQTETATRPLSVAIPPSQAFGRSTFGRLRAIALLPVFAIASIAQATGMASRQVARDIANSVRDVRRFRRRHAELRNILVSLKPRILIVGQDSLAADLTFLLHAAGELGIPRLLTPFAMFSLQETADYALANKAHHVDASPVNRVVARIFPHWTLHYAGINLLRLPGYRALALELTGLVKALPWTPLSEPAEAVTASSAVAADALVGLGINRTTLHVIGSPIHDRLATLLADRTTLRARLCAQYNLDAAKPLLVCGWPVNIFPWLAGRPAAYADYPAVAAAWSRILDDIRRRHGINIIVSVHPKTLDAEIDAAYQSGLPCKRGDADELIAACDLFTTLNGSSITAWAIASGIPVVLFDCFYTRYTDFEALRGCIQVDNEDAFSLALHRLCADPTAREELAAHQRVDAARWGQLDGKAGARLSSLIAQLAGAPQ